MILDICAALFTNQDKEISKFMSSPESLIVDQMDGLPAKRIKSSRTAPIPLVNPQINLNTSQSSPQTPPLQPAAKAGQHEHLHPNAMDVVQKRRKNLVREVILKPFLHLWFLYILHLFIYLFYLLFFSSITLVNHYDLKHPASLKVIGAFY